MNWYVIDTTETAGIRRAMRERLEEQPSLANAPARGLFFATTARRGRTRGTQSAARDCGGGTRPRVSGAVVSDPTGTVLYVPAAVSVVCCDLAARARRIHGNRSLTWVPRVELDESTSVLYVVDLSELRVTTLDAATGEILARQEAGGQRKGLIVEQSYDYNAELGVIVIASAGSSVARTGKFEPEGIVAIYDAMDSATTDARHRPGDV